MADHQHGRETARFLDVYRHSFGRNQRSRGKSDSDDPPTFWRCRTIRALPRSLAILLGVLLVLAYVATMGALRTGAGKFAIGISGITLYMEVPLINFEYQCGLIAFGPYIFSIPDLLLGLLPYRTIEFLGGGAGREEILYPEPYASAGLYGPLHLYTGLWGCLVFAFVLGVLCKYAYVKARRNDLFLLIYAQCAWALFVTNSFNLFLILLYVPAPLVAFTCFYWVLKFVQGRRRIKSKDQFAAPIAAQAGSRTGSLQRRPWLENVRKRN
jgi:hypothetical protein